MGRAINKTVNIAEIVKVYSKTSLIYHGYEYARQKKRICLQKLFCFINIRKQVYYREELFENFENGGKFLKDV